MPFFCVETRGAFVTQLSSNAGAVCVATNCCFISNTLYVDAARNFDPGHNADFQSNVFSNTWQQLQRPDTLSVPETGPHKACTCTSYPGAISGKLQAIN